MELYITKYLHLLFYKLKMQHFHVHVSYFPLSKIAWYTVHVHHGVLCHEECFSTENSINITIRIVMILHVKVCT